MKFLLSCQIPDIDLLKSMLAEERIVCEVINITSAHPRFFRLAANAFSTPAT